MQISQVAPKMIFISFINLFLIQDLARKKPAHLTSSTCSLFRILDVKGGLHRLKELSKNLVPM